MTTFLIDLCIGVWAATVGTERMLKLFAKYDIKSTWFIPGHTLESFPEEMAAVRDAGHEIGLHGYTHENPADMTIEQQRDVLEKTYKLITQFAGKPPRGSVAPWYSVLPNQAQGLINLTRLQTGGKQVLKAPSFCSTAILNTTIA